MSRPSAADGGRYERRGLDVYKRQVYERIMAQNEMYRKLAAAEAEVADGAELLDLSLIHIYRMVQLVLVGEVS